MGNALSLAFISVPQRILGGFWYQSGWTQFYWSWPVNLLFSLVLAAAVVGLVHRHVDRNALVTLWTIAIAGFLSVWVIATQTGSYQARTPSSASRRWPPWPPWGWKGGDCQSGSFSRRWDCVARSWPFNRTCWRSTGLSPRQESCLLPERPDLGHAQAGWHVHHRGEVSGHRSHIQDQVTEKLILTINP